MLAIIIASTIMGKSNLTTCPKNRKHYIVVDSMEPPSKADSKAYPPVKQVYIIRKSVRYKQKVHMLSVGDSGYQFGKYITDQKFEEILKLALGNEEFHQ